MLERMSARELSAWFAWEQANGPLNDEYSNDMLAQIHTMLQRVVQAVAVGAGAKDDQIPPIEHVLRPPEVMAKARELAKQKEDGVGPEYRS
jgi:hypothetical protein